ncbi:hypothetical protein HanOQP8_Chr03g0109091 [Helianthus annuus]|nr:hypothetical protein HanHA89_Chr03g0108201 [Helianthus annuus]KAJ0774219.1 hypothetical protein HanOQP8_Chr03g0109091 [Helianthus annuus]
MMTSPHQKIKVMVGDQNMGIIGLIRLVCHSSWCYVLEICLLCRILLEISGFYRNVVEI